MNKQRIVALVGTLVMLLPAAALAQSYLTLREAVSRAVQGDRVAEAEVKEQQAAREAKLAHARFGPTLFTGTGAMFTWGFPQTPGGAPPSVFNLAFTQTLFDGPARGRSRAADQRLDLQRLRTMQARDAVTTETVLTYLQLAGIRQSLDRQRRARESAQKVVDLTLERLTEGRVLPVAVLQERLVSARLVQRATQLEGRAAALEDELRILTGLSSRQPIQVAFETLPPLPVRSVPELVAMAEANSPDLKAAHLERRAREENLAGERSGYWPSISLVGNYAVFSRFNNLDTFFNRFERHNLNVGMEARVPIFNAETSAAVALARSLVREADVAAKRQQDQIGLDVRVAAQQLHESVAAGEVAELELALAQENVRLTEARLAEGRTDRLDLEKALVEEGRAWDGFFQSAFERERGQLQLRQITGELSRLFP